MYQEVGFDYDYVKDRIYKYLATMGELNSLDSKIKVHIIKAPGGRIVYNANAKKVSEKEYSITIYKDLLDCIRTGVSTYLEHITEEDLDCIKVDDELEFYDNYNCFFPDDCLLNKFYNHISSLILDNIVRHEVGHIVLGHCDGGGTHTESRRFNSIESFYYQNCEMQADWFGVMRGFSGNITFNLGDKEFDIYKSKNYRIIKQHYFCYFVAIFVQHSLFFVNNCWERKILTAEHFTKRKHACELVRMRYNYDALVYGLANSLFRLDKGTDAQCYNYAYGMAEAFTDDLNCFLKYLERYTYKDVFENNLVDFYYSVIRLDKYYNNGYSSKIALPAYMPKLSAKEFLLNLAINHFDEFFKEELTEKEQSDLNEE